MAPLPLYPWNRQRCWIDPPQRTPVADEDRDPIPVALLGSPVTPAYSWQTEISLESTPWIGDHRIDGEAVLPAAAFIQIAHAAWKAVENGSVRIEWLEIRHARALEPGCRYTLQTVATRLADGGLELRISSRLSTENPNEWQLHASAVLKRRLLPMQADVALGDLLRRQMTDITGALHYATAAARGIEYGERFQSLRRLRHDNCESMAELKTPARGGPGWIDGCLQSMQPLLDGSWMPVRFERLILPERATEAAFAHSRLLDPASPGRAVASLLILSAAGTVVGQCESIWLAPIRLAERQELYHVEWREEPSDNGPTSNGRWLIVTDDGVSYGAALAQMMAARGQAAVLIRAEDNSLDREACSNWSGVVYLSRASADFDPDVCGRALPVVQRMALQNATGSPRFRIVTQGVHAPSETGELLIGGAPLWGLRRTMATEFSHMRAGAIDIGGPGDVGLLSDELLTGCWEDEVVLRNGRRRAGRLAPFESEHTQSLEPWIRTDAAYLITGGLGGLGLLTAEWLASKGARHLALISRSPATAHAQSRIAALQATGTQVWVIQVDVGAAGELAAAFEKILTCMPALRGIIHAAGRLDDALIENLTAARFRKVLDPKAGGAWNLHQLSLNCQLDWFVCYSSAGALLGAPGQANHAAANAFLDVLAWHRRARGLPALTINWGPWSSHGKAAGEVSEALTRRGLVPLDVEDGFRALDVLARSDATQAARMNLDFATWTKYYPNAAKSAFFADLKRTDSAAPIPRTPRGKCTLQETERMLVQAAAGLLSCDPDSIDRKSPLREYGLDSLRALELRNRMEGALGIRVPATVMWRYPTVAVLAAHIHEMALRSAAV
jgi:NAD(P)-dependent dehydrogenase (short-subunit alcohol dehydrogenase family)/acyl carrier protein